MGGTEGKEGCVSCLFPPPPPPLLLALVDEATEQHPLPAARLVEFRSLFLPLRIARTAAR